MRPDRSERPRDLPVARVTISKVAFGGAGLGTLPDGKVCFVPGVIPGEVATVRILKQKKSYAEGVVETLHEVSPQRVKPPCPVAGICGGCQYQHIAYQLQLEIKRNQVAEVLSRIGGLENPPVQATAPSPQEFAYRNRITVHVRGGRVGFFERGTRTVVDVAVCPIASADVNRQLAGLRANRPADGEYALREASDYRGFRQVNQAAADVLLEVVAECAKPGGAFLVDAFCGAGFFARRLQSMFREVVGIEWSADAVRHARTDAPEHVKYLQGDVSHHLPEVLEMSPSDQTTLLVDPPAEGLPQAIIESLLLRPPARLLYVSCDPATLARDLKKLAPTHRVLAIHPVDMFPQTAQIECVAVLES